jgi:hypothetical protein
LVRRQQVIIATRISAQGSDLVVVEVESGSQKLVKPLPFGDAAFGTGAAFSRDGTQIAFDGPLGTDQLWKVAVMSLDGSDETIVTSGEQNEKLLGYSTDPDGLIIARDVLGSWDAILFERQDARTFKAKQTDLEILEVDPRGTAHIGHRRYRAS